MTLDVTILVVLVGLYALWLLCEIAAGPEREDADDG